MADKAPKPRPHALRQDCIAYFLACQVGADFRPQANDTVREVTRSHIDRTIDPMTHVDELITRQGPPSPAHLWIIEIHQASAYTGADDHRESLIHGLPPVPGWLLDLNSRPGS
jgi:hypothetical protein